MLTKAINLPFMMLLKRQYFAKKLIDEQPASKLYISDDDERTPLHWAVSFNNPDLVQYILLKTPNDLDIDEYVDGSGWTYILLPH